MNLVKANIIGGAANGRTLWVDKDSCLNHWNNGSYVTTYKTYGTYCGGTTSKDKITSSDYHARIKKEFIKLINEEPEAKSEPKASSMFETIVTTYGNQPIFSIFVTEGGDFMKGDITLNECKKWIKDNSDYECDFEIVMTIMKTSTVKQMKPTI